MNIGIVGGGASGMLLASMLKSKPDLKITLIEKNTKLGKKLLLTGNGKCNFTNYDFSDLTKVYNNDFARTLYKLHNNVEFIKFLNSLGIVSKYEVHKGIKYYYPNTNKSTSVYYALYDKIIENGIKILYDKCVSDIDIKENVIRVHTNDEILIYDKLIIATGGMSYKNTGSDGSMYTIIKKLGHEIVKPLPALVGFTYCDTTLNKLKGVRVDACVNIKISNNSDIDNIESFTESGEIQFNENYISGIPIMNLSRLVNRYIDEGHDVDLYIDFYKLLATENNLNDLDLQSEKKLLIEHLTKRKHELYYKNVKDFLCGFLPDEIGEAVIKRSKVNAKITKDIKESDIESIAYNITNFKISKIGIGSFDSAQVTIGGVKTTEINNSTLESRIVKGLYFMGEVMDIDGMCGGYNLQLMYSTASTIASVICNM